MLKSENTSEKSPLFSSEPGSPGSGSAVSTFKMEYSSFLEPEEIGDSEKAIDEVAIADRNISSFGKGIVSGCGCCFFNIFTKGNQGDEKPSLLSSNADVSSRNYVTESITAVGHSVVSFGKGIASDFARCCFFNSPESENEEKPKYVPAVASLELLS